ncbi:hypothetical protein [uncultured Aggregatibacter sp.]|mgnify:FL=1|uniref:hypothetical protein n=1 Tax=uncultured Aggregatibacter sp. TaxID=470564 RepID=UPI001A43DE64|nr:hypothetical protein [uncultured Aggregatibacter sp.]VTX87539.1 VI_FHA: type VI secretion system FHA domain protein [uncultured Aggregatibacter sp.]
MHKLLLTITDASMLEKGTLPYCYFDFAGGLVGSAPNVSWKVNNWRNEISGIEFEVKYYNSSFCLISHSKNIFINSTTSSLPQGGIVRLNDNDLIILYNYKIRAKIFTNEAEIVSLQDELSCLLNKRAIMNIPNLDSQYNNYDTINNTNQNDLLEPRINLDPLLALKVDKEPSLEEIGIIPYQSISNMEYKFFNPNINSVSEYYTPPNFMSTEKSIRVKMLNSDSQYDKSKDIASSSNKNDYAKREEITLDPLFLLNN